MSFFKYFFMLCMLNWLFTSTAADLPNNSVQAGIHRKELPQPPAGKKIAWMAHRGGWGDSAAYATRLTTLHYDDELLYGFPDGLTGESRMLASLGDVFFLQDFGNMKALADAGKQAGLDYAFLFTLSHLALVNQKIETEEKCTDYLLRNLDIRKEYTNYFKIDGKPVVFFFAINGFKDLSSWRQITDDIRGAYPAEKLQLIAQQSVYQVLGKPDPKQYLKEVFELFDGIIFWGGEVDAKLKNAKLVREVISESKENKMIFWALMSGYWRPEKGMYTSPECTRDWRNQLKIAFEMEFDGLVLESWNDFGEHTMFAPSRENGGAFFELVRYYITLTNQKEYFAEDPGFLLIHPKEVLLGNVLEFELISLPVKSPRSTVQLLLESENGEAMYISPVQATDQHFAEVFEFSVPTQLLASGTRLSYNIFVDGKLFKVGSWTDLRKSKVEDPWVRGIVLAKLMEPQTASFSIAPSDTPDGDQRSFITAKLHLENDVPFKRVDIYENDVPVWSLDAEYLNQERKWVYDKVALELEFSMPKSYPSENMNRSGTLSVSGGNLVRAYNAGGSEILDADGRVAWEATGTTQTVLVLADAQGASQFTIHFPALNKTVSFSLDELRTQGLMEVMTSGHARLWIKEVNHPVIWGSWKKNLGSVCEKEIIIKSASQLACNEYYLWALDVSNRVYRSQPVRINRSSDKMSSSRWFWDSNENKRFPAEVSSAETVDLSWSFDGPESRVYLDKHRHGCLAQLGGGLFRAGHYNPEAVPGVVSYNKGMALLFEGDDYVQLDAGCFPYGSFELQMNVCPDRLTAPAQTLFYCGGKLEVFLLPSGKVGIEFKIGANKQLVELIHPDPISTDKWSAVAVRYDYQNLTLTVNGTDYSTTLMMAEKPSVSSEGYLGARVSGAHTTYSGRFFSGKLADIQIFCGAPVVSREN